MQFSSRMISIYILAVLATLGLGMKVQVKSALTFDAEASKNRPVTKVVNLLKDMLKEMEKEGEEDEDIYEKFACWCTTGEKEKTKSIADAQARITVLQTDIEKSTADSSRLG